MHFSADVHLFNVGEAHFFIEVKPWQLLVVVVLLLAWNHIERLARVFIEFLVLSLHILHGIAALFVAAIEWLWESHASARSAFRAELTNAFYHQRG